MRAEYIFLFLLLLCRPCTVWKPVLRAMAFNTFFIDSLPSFRCHTAQATAISTIFLPENLTLGQRCQIKPCRVSFAFWVLPWRHYDSKSSQVKLLRIGKTRSWIAKGIFSFDVTVGSFFSAFSFCHLHQLSIQRGHRILWRWSGSSSELWNSGAEIDFFIA